MGDYKRIITLTLIMAAATSAVLGVTFWLLYNAAFEEQRLRLVNMTHSSAHMIESVAHFDQENNTDYPEGAIAATISQIRTSHQEFEGFGETGEFVIARRDGDQISFVLRHRFHSPDEHSPTIPFDSVVGKPIHRSLSGLSGTVVIPDYRGVPVLAAYEPVDILNMGIVAKMDIAEIRAPFVKVGIIIIILAVLLITIGTLLFFRLGEPLIRALRQSREQYRAIVQGHPDLIGRFLPDGTVTFVNDAFCNYFGKTRDELVGYKFMPLIPEEDVKGTMDSIASLSRDHPVATHQNRVIIPNGEIHWVRWTNMAICDEEGHVIEYQSGGHDITERKKAVAALHESEEQFRDFAEVAADWFWEMGADLRFTNFAKEAGLKFGMDTETIIGKRRWESAKADLSEEKWAKHKADLEAHQDFRNFEFSITDDDGRHRFVQISGKAVFDADGNFVGYRGTGRDITEQETANRQLKEKSQSLVLLQRTATASNEATSIEEALQVCLDEVCAYTGWPVGHVYLYDEDAEELFPSMFWHIDDPERFSAFRQVTEATFCKSGVGLPGRALANREPVWIADVSKDSNFPRAKRKNIGVKTGFAFPVFVGKQIAAVLEFYTDNILNQDTALLALMNNIGTQLGRVMERERAEKALRQSSEMTRTLLSSTGQGIFALDLNGNGIIANPACAEILGYGDADYFLGQNMHMLIHHTHADGTPYPASECRIAQAYRERNGIIVDDEVFWRADGTSFPVEYRAYPLYRDADVIGTVTTFDDITLRLETDSKLNQAQKMDAIGHMVGGIAHDFNNLLGIVIGNLEILQRLVGDQEKANKRVETALKGARRGASLTQKLLGFSRREAIGAEAQNVNQLILHSHDLLDKILVKSVELKLDLADDLWLAAVDAGDFENAIMNLCINARDAMPDGGKIIIETINIYLGTDYVKLNPGSKVGDYVHVSVSDTGGGMPPEIIEQVFEPFFTTKERGRGTGLGLSMIYGFVKRSGGYIKIYSEVGHGTTIKMYLPRALGAEELVTETDITETAAELPHGKETVLVVDDEEDLVDLAVEQLEGLGYRTFATINGVEAMKILSSRKKIDLLFSDIIMPGKMDGYELALKALEKRPRLRVLLTSGYTAKREEDTKYADNPVITELAASLLNKPYTKPELANRIRWALDREE